MPFVSPDFALALPEILVLSLACLILVIDVFLPSEKRQITYQLTQVTLLIGLLAVLLRFGQESVIGFDGHYIRDSLSDVLKCGLFLISMAVFVYSREYLRERDLFKGEFYILGLFGVLGMMIMISAHSFLTIYLGLELLSLSLYALVAFNRDDSDAAEAAMKYFVLGALASGMLLYGISMIYGATGSILISGVQTELAEAGEFDRQLLLSFGLVFLVVGMAFKLGAVPFHMWLPDVYQGAPTAVTLYLGAAPKLAAFAIVMRILAEGLGTLQQDWQAMLVILALLSLITGNLIAIAQTNIKRMLAYSTIAHIGFLLLGVLAGNTLGYTAALFYVLTYVLMATAAFGVILMLSHNGQEADHISDFKGLNERNPWLAFIMLLVMMSLAGIPFLVGFYAKLIVLQAAINAGFIWLAIVAVVFSVIGAFYYLRIVKYMYFDSPASKAFVIPALDSKIVISTNGLLIIVLGLYPTALLIFCQMAFPA